MIRWYIDILLGHYSAKEKDQNLARCKWRGEPFTSLVSKALMVNLARCTWRGEPMHRSVRSPNGNANMDTRLFSI